MRESPMLMETNFVVVDIKSRQFVVTKGQKLECDKLDLKEGDTIEFDILTSSKGLQLGGKARFKAYKDDSLGKKVVVFYKTKRNADKKFKGKGGCRKMMSHLELVDFNLEGGA